MSAAKPSRLQRDWADAENLRHQASQAVNKIISELVDAVLHARKVKTRSEQLRERLRKKLQKEDR